MAVPASLRLKLTLAGAALGASQWSSTVMKIERRNHPISSSIWYDGDKLAVAATMLAAATAGALTGRYVGYPILLRSLQRRIPQIDPPLKPSSSLINLTSFNIYNFPQSTHRRFAMGARTAFISTFACFPAGCVIGSTLFMGGMFVTAMTVQVSEKGNLWEGFTSDSLVRLVPVALATPVAVGLGSLAAMYTALMEPLQFGATVVGGGFLFGFFLL